MCRFMCGQHIHLQMQLTKHVTAQHMRMSQIALQHISSLYLQLPASMATLRP